AGDTPSGIRYYSIPGGHEFNSFVIALYNVAGKGQAVSDEIVSKVTSLKKPHKLQVMATLGCTNCPDVVMGTQRLASLSDKLEAEMYDINHFPDIREKYNIMAVPCLIIDESSVFFGKKSLEELASIIASVDAK
ncbi:MAG: thioredoxin family protein, partial [Coprobacillus sp.]|nr:thioredoxin family protein [Coprobacillus sp.]